MTDVLAKTDILVVDDEPDILDVVRFSLTSAGFAVRGADSGVRALEEIAAKQPDLVVLDLMLPEMNGLEICRMLRRGAETALIPVLMMTARSSDEDILMGFDAGADDYVTKPFHPRVLAGRVKAILDRVGRTENALRPVTGQNACVSQVSVCSYCKRVRDVKGGWHDMENYFSARLEMSFTHGICGDCNGPILEAISQDKE